MSRRSTATICCLVLLAVSSGHAACIDIDPGPIVPVPPPCAGYTPLDITYVVDSLEDLTDMIGDPPASTYWANGLESAAFRNYEADLGGTPSQATASAFNFGNAANAQAMFDDPQYGAIGVDVIDWPGTGPVRQFVFGDTGLFYFRERCLYCIMISPAPSGDATGLRCMAEAMLARIADVVDDESISWSVLKQRW